MKKLIPTLIIPMFMVMCATKAIYAPSTQPLQSDLGRAAAHVDQAKTLAQRIHDKDVIIDMWNEQHRSKQ